MKRYYFTQNGYTFKRIPKNQARRAYKLGLTVLISPCNLHPFSVWGVALEINRKSREHFVIDEIGLMNDFNNLVKSFEYYNCINSETGKYTAFYIPIQTVDRFTGEATTARTMGTVEQYDYRYMGVTA